MERYCAISDKLLSVKKYDEKLKIYEIKQEIKNLWRIKL